MARIRPDRTDVRRRLSLQLPVWMQTGRAARRIERLHDLRLVRPPARSESQALVVCRAVLWGIALFEYLLQVPANRIGATTLSLAQLKIMQEVITLLVFVPFVVLYMKQPLKLDYLWAALCMLGAVYFIFRN
jgi:uncharacterized protein (DUF486 family)